MPAVILWAIAGIIAMMGLAVVRFSLLGELADFFLAKADEHLVGLGQSFLSLMYIFGVMDFLSIMLNAALVLLAFRSVRLVFGRFGGGS